MCSNGDGLVKPAVNEIRRSALEKVRKLAPVELGIVLVHHDDLDAPQPDRKWGGRIVSSAGGGANGAV